MEANQLDVELARVLCLTHIRVPCHKWLCFPSNFPRFHVLAQIWTRYLWMRFGECQIDCPRLAKGFDPGCFIGAALLSEIVFTGAY